MAGESRRDVLRSLARCSAGLAAAAAWPLGGCAPFINSGPSPGVRVASLDQLSPGTAQRTTVRGEPIIVLNDGGTVRAFSGVCTHEACELGWNPSQRLIRCPCHGSAFDVRGRVTRGPAIEPLPEFATAVDGTRVYVGEVLPAPASSRGVPQPSVSK